MRIVRMVFLAALAASLSPAATLTRDPQTLQSTAVSIDDLLRAESPGSGALPPEWLSAMETHPAVEKMSEDLALASPGVPEPTTFLLLGVGLVAVGLIHRRRPRKR